MALRPRLLVVSLAVALGVGVVGGWILHRMNADAAAVVLTTPGEYQEPLDPELVGDDVAPATGRTVPDVVLTDVDGLDVRSSDLLGDPLVINVWFSTCPPCARELGDFAEVHAEVGDRVRFVGVNPFDGAESMTRFAAERGVAYELLRDDDGAFIDGVGLSSFPRTYFVDATGIIVSEVGEVHADELRQMIEELL
jgi:peroxiredoxin